MEGWIVVGIVAAVVAGIAVPIVRLARRMRRNDLFAQQVEDKLKVDPGAAWNMARDRRAEVSHDLYDRCAEAAAKEALPALLEEVEREWKGDIVHEFMRQFGYTEHTAAEWYRTLLLLIATGSKTPREFYDGAKVVTHRRAQYVLMQFGRRAYWWMAFNERKGSASAIKDVVAVFPEAGWVDTLETRLAFMRTLTPLGAVRAAKYFAISPGITASFARDALKQPSNDPRTFLAEVEEVLDAGAEVGDIRDCVERCYDAAMAGQCYAEAERIAGVHLKDGTKVREVQAAWRGERHKSAS